MAAARILIVEDEAITAEGLRERLERLGYAVTGIAAGGEEALSLIEQTSPDLVLMDIHLRGPMDGIETAEAVRARFGIPVIYLTAYADAETLARAKATTPLGYITKPFMPDTLHSAIQVALYKHQMDQQLCEARDDLERQVEERTAELAISNRQQTALNLLLRLSLEDLSLHEQLERSLDIILSISWLPLIRQGGVFLVVEEGTLELVAQRGLEDGPAQTCRRVPFGRCLCGRAAASGEIEYAADVDERHEIRYPGIVAHGHYCIPIVSGGRVLGVTALYLEAGHRRDAREEEFLLSVAHTLASMIERKRAEESLRQARAELERRVEERTAELLEANRQLQRANVELAQSEEKFRRTIEESLDGIALTDEEGVVVVWNQSMERITGLPAAEVIGRPIWEVQLRLAPDRIRTPERRREIEERIRRALRSGEAPWMGQALETIYLHPDGGRRVIQGNIFPIRTAQGFMLGSVSRDVTERRRSEEEIRLLQAITQATSEASDSRTALQIVLEKVCQAAGWSIGEAWLPRADGSALERGPAWWSDDAALERFVQASEQFTFPPGVGLPGRVWASMRTEWMCNVAEEAAQTFPRFALAAEAGLAAGFGVPITAGGQVLAVLCFYISESRQKDERLLDLISTIAAQLGSLIQRKQAEESLAWESNVNAALADLAQAVLRSDSVADIADLVLAQAKRLTGSAFGFVGHIDPDTGNLVSTTLSRDIWETCQVAGKSVVFHEFKGLWGWVLTHRQSLLTNEPSADPRSGGVPAGHIPIERFLSAPAMIGAELVGQVALANPPRDYMPRDLALVERLAALYALAVQRQRTAEALRRSEERYALAQQAAHIGSWDWDIQTGALQWSEQIEPMFGFGPGEFGATYEAFLQSVHPEDRQRVTDAVNDAIERGEDYAVEHRVVWPDGTVVWMLENGAVIRDEDGRPVRMLGIVQDITGRKWAESALRRYGEEQAMLYAITAAVARTLEIETLLPTVLDTVLPALQADGGWVALIQGPDAPLRVAAWRGVPESLLASEAQRARADCPACFLRPGADGAPPAPDVIRQCPHLMGEIEAGRIQYPICVPLIAGGEVLGMLGVVWRTPHAYYEQDHNLLMTIGQQIGIALHNARLYEAARQVDRLRLLNEIGLTAASSLEAEATLGRVLEMARRAVNAEEGSILAMDAETGDLIFTVIQPANAYPRTGQRLLREGSVAGWVVEHGQTARVDNAASDPRWRAGAESLTCSPLHSLCSVPLKLHGQVTGVLEVLNKRGGGPWSDDDVSLLEAIASIAAITLENIRLYAAARARADEMTMLNEIGLALTATLDFSTVVHTALARTRRLFQAERTALLQPVSSTDPFNYRVLTFDGSAQMAASIQIKEREGIIGWVLAESRAALVEDAPLDVRFSATVDRCMGGAPRAMLAVPLLTPTDAGQARVGGVLIATGDQPGHFAPEELRTLQTLASTLAVALENARLYEHLKRLLREREETQAQLIHVEKMSALGRLVASIAHEINNPLQAVQGCLTLAEEEMRGARSEAKLMRYLAIAGGEIDRIATIVRRMRDFYRPAREGMHPTDILAVLKSVLELTAKQLEHSGVRLVEEYAPALPLIHANADQLKQVFLNMVINAVDAMPQGGVLTIRAAAAEMEKPGQAGKWPFVRVDVGDTGVGLSPEAQARLFEPFFTTKDHGSGLGLSISYGIIESHDGQIDVMSAPGEGTTFMVWLPASPPTA